MAGVSIQLCLITTMAGITKGKVETIRRKFYRVLESASWATPLGWVMDLQTCNEVKEKLQVLADEFARESGGKQLFYLETITISYGALERLLQNAKEPANQEIAMRLKKILELRKHLVEISE